VITGVVAPVVAFYFGVTGPAQTSTLALALSEIIWIGIAAALHFLARRFVAEIGPVTWFQIYALYLSPLIALAFGIVIYLIASRSDRPRHLPGE
jgi:predicted membrane-bound dolichyl-phosphate-mannose-protein mannosyltransferase